jgi:signal transduction histidine kinase
MSNQDMVAKDSRFQSKILIVDDDEQHVEMLCDCIEDYVTSIVTAINGLEAIAKAKEELPDIILMDVMMPEMNGFDACKKIKEDSTTKHIPVIFITALNDLESILRAFDSGGVDYVSKPFHTKEVVSRLKNHLKVQFQQRQLMDLAIELKSARESAESARMIAEKANQAKTDFLCNVSHELMTPMNMIMNMTHFALDSGLNTQQSEYLSNIKKSSELLKELIDDILEYSSCESGNVSSKQEIFQVRDVLSTVQNKLSFRLKEGNQIQLFFSEDPLIPQQLIGDAARLQKILFHLGDNAIKFTSSGYVKIKSRLLEIKDAKARVAFSVKDTGPGMSKKQQEALFQPFIQADSSKTRKHGGVGLGLALCRQLIKMMNGKLFINSVPDEGSIVNLQFDFAIPVTKEAVVPAEITTSVKTINNANNKSTSENDSRHLNDQQLIDLLEQLDTHIKKRNPRKGKQICDEILNCNIDKAIRDHIEQVHDSLRRYKFKNAQDQLSSVRTRNKLP